MLEPAAKDEELVGLARAGHKEAFGWLIERHERAGLRLAQRMVGQLEVAQELVQEALLQAYLSLEHLHDAAHFGGWFYGIVLNVCRNYLRRRPHQDFYSLENLTGGLQYGELALLDDQPGLQEMQEQRELHQTVLAAIQTLTAPNQAATLLFYYQQLTLPEIAALLNISVAAVKGRLHKSRRQLRGELARLLPEMVYTVEQNTKGASKTKTTGGKIMIRVKIAALRSSLKFEALRVVVLADEAEERLVPIWIGKYEANMIAMALQNVPVSRPLTYDFMLKTLEATGTILEEVVIETVKDMMFYAIAKFRSGAQLHEIDARPSDALALAVRTNCPIYVTEELMQQAGYPAAKSTEEINRRDQEIEEKKAPIEIEPLTDPEDILMSED